MSKEVFRLGELFCGPGGIACGAHNAVSDDGEKTIVVGHTPVQQLGFEPVPQFLNNNIILCDTGSFIDAGMLSCVDVLSGKYWQS